MSWRRRGNERFEKMKKGLMERADAILASLEHTYEIDSEKARDLSYKITYGLSDDVDASWWERWRSKRVSHVSFANAFAAAKTNYEKFRAADDVMSAKCAQELVDWFNTGLTNGVFKLRNNLEDRDLRALILGEIYRRKREGEEVLTSPKQYADLLGVQENLVNFNLEYLLDKGLVEGDAIGSLGTTKKIVMIHNISSRGIDAVEGRNREQFEINFNIINIGSVTSSQVAAGSHISQVQGSGKISNFGDLYHYVEGNFAAPQVSALKPLLEQLEAEAKKDSVKPSTLKRIADLLSTYGPAGMVVTDALMKLLGLKA